MCGIVGAVVKSYSGFFPKQQNSVYQMLYADALRGDDSTGIIGVETDSTFHIAKEAVGADWFIHQLKYSKDCKVFADDVYKRGKVIVGHNRKKTMGKVEDTTAHPFVVDDKFAFVHNGTLNNHQSLAKTEVDSEALAIHLHKAVEKAAGDRAKIKENLEEALGKVYGAYAVVFYDQESHRLFLLRNKERPLALIETDDAWYFMSEPMMGAWILGRNDYKYTDLKTEMIAEHELVTFELGENKVYKDHLTLKKSWSPVFVDNERRGTIGKVKASTTATVDKSIPDKELKRFRKSVLGKRIAFWVDEILEDDICSTIEDGQTKVTLFGRDEECEWFHDLIADVDLKPLSIASREQVLERKWSGIVEAIGQAQSGCLKIYIKNAKPMLNLPKKTEAANEESFGVKSKRFREQIGSMPFDDLWAFYEESKGGLESWKISHITVELAFRNSINSVEEAANLARTRDNCILKQKKVGNSFIYMNDDGRIYYETPIIVH